MREHCVSDGESCMYLNGEGGAFSGGKCLPIHLFSMMIRAKVYWSLLFSCAGCG